MSEHFDLPPHEEAPEQLSDLAVNGSLNPPASALESGAAAENSQRTDQIESFGTHIIAKNIDSRNKNRPI
jgi:hypothetical protein